MEAPHVSAGVNPPVVGGEETMLGGLRNMTSIYLMNDEKFMEESAAIRYNGRKEPFRRA